QPEQPRLVYRFDIFRKEGGGLIEHRVPVIVPLCPAQPVGGARKGRNNVACFVKDRTAAAVIEVEVGKHHVGHLLRRITDLSDFAPQLLQVVRTVILQFGQLFVASTTVDQDTALAGFDKE